MVGDVRYMAPSPSSPCRIRDAFPREAAGVARGRRCDVSANLGLAFRVAVPLEAPFTRLPGQWEPMRQSLLRHRPPPDV